MLKKIIAVIIVIILSIVLIFFFLKNSNKEKVSQNIKEELKERSYSSNIIENVKYSSNDANGNKYTITAKEGEIDIKNSNVIYLKNVSAIIELNNSKNIQVSSNFGKYNIGNFDTIFTKNVIIKYLQNKINGDYLDFSILRNSMIVSKNVVFTNDANVLRTDVIEINIKTKDTKFFMYDKNNKVSLINKN